MAEGRRNGRGSPLKAVGEARSDAVERLGAPRYFWRQAHWLQERFPDAILRDVEGLVKLVGHDELAANDWSLTPGRYVGVAPEEEDEDFDFEQTMRDIHVELDELNSESVRLAATIKRNFQALGLWTERKSMGRRRAGASIPAPPGRGELPADYAVLLGEIKERIRTERVRVVLAANQAMVLLYWDIGKAIFARQEREGWGAGTIDRLSHDLREAFPEMRGFSPRKPQVHARLGRSLARARNRATHRCTNSLAQQSGTAAQTGPPGDTHLVRPQGH